MLTDSMHQHSSDRRHLFWGWYIVAAAFMLMALNYGARYSFGIFVQPLAADHGWSRAAASLAASINLLVYALAGIGSGRLLDRLAPRWIATAGAAASAAGFILCTAARTPLEFYLAYGILYGCGSAWMGTVTLSTSVGKWFDRKRGLAIGLASMGVSFGTLTLSPVAAYILDRFSWRTGFAFIALNLLLAGVVIAQLLLRRTVPEAYGLAPDGEGPAAPATCRPAAAADRPQPSSRGRSPYQDSRFWILASCHSIAAMAALMAFIHQVPYAVTNGISPLAAAASLGAMGFAGLAGQFFFGWLSDRIGNPKFAAALGYLLMAAGLIVLLQARTAKTLMAYALVFGFGYGCLGPLLPIMAAHWFGRLRIGTVYGLLTFFVAGVGGALGPLAGGLIYDATGSYRGAWWLMVGALAGAIAAILSLRCRPPELDNGPGGV